MRPRLLWALLLVTGLCGCATNQQVTTPTPAVTTYTYNGTASVGDFLTITINKAALTINYTNLSNGDTGTVPYTVNANGSFTITDPNGNLTQAYEIPGYALLIQSAKSGPDHNTPALITAVESAPATLATFVNNSYNYIQFRTSSGGPQIGSVTIGATTGQTTSYWPYGALNGEDNSAFDSNTLEFSGITEAASGTYFTMDDGGGTDTVFGTASGFFIVDTGNGSILGLKKAATPDFNPAVAGTYTAIYYQKANASVNNENVESGTPSLGQATIVISATGNITVTDSQGNTLINAPLTPVANATYLYGSAGEMTDPCNGLFTFRAVTSTYQHDVFVTFVGNAVVFSKFSVNLPWNQQTGTYTYLYGVGLQ